MFQINIFGVQKHRNLCADYDIRCTKLFEVCSSKMEVISLEQSKIEEIICKLDSNHPLRNACNTEYQNTLIEKLAILQNLKETKLKTLLCGNERTLKPGGIFLFNIEQPVFTAGVGQDWIYTDDGKPQYWAIDNYFITGERNTHFLGCDVVKQHHTLTQIIMGLLNNGFELKVVEEAEPPKEMMDIPGMEDELRRPMMLLVKAIAKK